MLVNLEKSSRFLTPGAWHQTLSLILMCEMGEIADFLV